jgi:site-specific recombinase
MWRSAAGAGVLIGVMALLKIKAAALHAPLFGEAFMFSMIYGLGFVVIFLLGMTVATKQPAMTAQTLAGLLGDLRLSRSADLERLVDVVAAVCRSQLAAIAGNVMVALPVAIAVGFGLAYLVGAPPISVDKGAPARRPRPAELGPAACRHRRPLPLPVRPDHRLFRQPRRLYRHRRPHRPPALAEGRFGRERANRIGSYIQDRLGGIMGNFLFGCMLGSTGVIGTILGLPLDIRHIAFSSANLGYALVGFQFDLPLKAIAWAALGVAAIGFTNLAVSFLLALRTAMRARGVQFEHGGPLFKALWRRLRQQPRSFFLPPARSAPTRKMTACPPVACLSFCRPAARRRPGADGGRTVAAGARRDQRTARPYLPDEAGNTQRLQGTLSEILATEGYFAPASNSRTATAACS